MQTVKNNNMLRAATLLLVAFFAVSCNKLPVGPEGPDPLPPPPPGTYISIADFRALYTGSGDMTIPAGTKKVRGVVISNNTNEASRNYRLQDESGAGLYLFAWSGSPVYGLGTVLEIDAAAVGVFTLWNGDLELKDVPLNKVVIKAGTIPITPREATVAQIIANRNTWASSLVRIKNVISISQVSSNSTGTTYNITDATGSLSMFVRHASGITVNTSGNMVTGYVSIYNTTTQIGIRSAADIQ